MATDPLAKHLGTGKVATDRSQIPPWHSVQGKGPWERTACGRWLERKHIAKARQKVSCGACRGTAAWRKK